MFVDRWTYPSLPIPLYPDHPSVWITVPGHTDAFDEGRQAIAGDVGNATHANSAASASSNLHRDGHDGLLNRLTPPHVGLRSADVSLVHLDFSIEFVPSGPHHRTPQFVQPSPRGLVTAQPQNALQAQRTNPEFLGRDVPHCQEPRPQWRTRALEDRASRRRGLTLARDAAELTTNCLPRRRAPAPRTTETIGPTNPLQILDTGGLGREPAVKLLESPRIVHATHRMLSPLVIHASILHLVPTRGKWIPT